MTAQFRKYHGLGNDYLVIDPNVYDKKHTEITEKNLHVLSVGFRGCLGARPL